ncbi:MAG: biotin/lipoyl-binding protein, partial [Cyanobacteriota bacterium]|nr:biotin/lipoyl-binding protein [Cyanobacteriota bacterium]
MKFFSSTSIISPTLPRGIPKNHQKGSAVIQQEAKEIASNSLLGNRTSLLQTTSCWSPTLNQFLEEPPATLPQHLTIGAMVFCLTCGAWAWFGTIDEVSKAQGKLIPQGETYKIEPVELGKVKHIAVKEGEKVKAGQTLVELDTELVQQEVVRLEQMSQAYQSELRQKQVLREQLRLEAKISADITKAESLAKQTDISLAHEKVTTFRRLLTQQQSEAQAYQTKLTNLEPLSILLQENSSRLKAEKILRQQRLDKLIPLAQQGAISQEYVFQVEQSLREVERQIPQSKIQEITQTREQIFQSHQAMRELESLIIHNQG